MRTVTNPSPPNRSTGSDLSFEALTIRWTIGNVHARGFELLRLSISCAFHLFGPAADYVVYVNCIDVDEARRHTGPLPVHVRWRQASRAEHSQALAPYMDAGLIEGMGWKLIPLRAAPEQHELALDNDCILWDFPSGLRQWLQEPGGVLFAEDVGRCLGRFDAICPPGNFNAGIRGLSPGVDLEAELTTALDCWSRPRKAP
jgi:hypothetical protein